MFINQGLQGRPASRRPVTDSGRSGMVEVTGAPSLEMKGTLLEPAPAAGGGLMPPCVRARCQVESCSSSSASPTCSAARRPPAARCGTSSKAPRRPGPRVSPRRARSRSRRSTTLRSEPVKKIATVLPISDEMLEDAPSDPGVPERAVDVVRQDRGGAAAAPRGGHERAHRALQPDRRPGDQHLHEARRGRQRGGLARVIANTAGTAFLSRTRSSCTRATG